MPTERIYIIGAGGHAKVVLDALLAGGGAPQRLLVTDDQPGPPGRTLLGIAVLAPALPAQLAGAWFHVAVGDAALRERLHRAALALGARALSVVHPRAVVSAHAVLGAGAFIAANAVLGPDSVVGEGVIVNHGAVVDHDVSVGAFSHVAPLASLGGAARIGARVLLGAGCRVLPRITVGDDAVIGAGAVLLGDVGPGCTAVGVVRR